jgi:uncharacterized membrane protein
MEISSPACTLKVRLVLMGLFGGFIAAFIGAPLLASTSGDDNGSLLYLCFSTICHQDAERSFMIAGAPWAVCQRCSGIYLGIFVTLMLPARFYQRLSSAIAIRRWWVLTASAPLVIDGTMSLLGAWDASAAARLGTGLLFGAMLTTLLVPAFTELIDNCWRRREAATEGGTS